MSYLTAVATGEVAGAAAEESLWSEYERRLERAQAMESMTQAWPVGCGDIDIIEDGLFSSIPYMKGAFFFRALAARVGEESVLNALSAFFGDNVGQAYLFTLTNNIVPEPSTFALGVIGLLVLGCRRRSRFR